MISFSSVLGNVVKTYPLVRENMATSKVLIKVKDFVTRDTAVLKAVCLSNHDLERLVRIRKKATICKCSSVHDSLESP